MIYDKVERRDILAKIDYWNFGILPNGKIASVPCFVHESVPEIKLFVKNKDNDDEDDDEDMTPIATKSEWTKNLVKSSLVYYKTKTDNSTLSSLSLCKSIFKNDDPAFKSNIDTIHYVNNKPSAYIEMGKIARLTGEFEEELRIAEEHWPSHPKKSWDKLCQIWYKYGFLWPEYVYLVQDHSPDYYTIIWRTHLRPMYEFFPVTHYREFVMDMISIFTGCLLNGKKFRLQNVRTGNYLLQQENEMMTMEAQVQLDKVWTFQDRLEPILKYQTPYICTGGKKIICSTGDNIDNLVELSIINSTKEGQLKLINYHIPINTPFNKIYIDNHWQWTIQLYNTRISSTSISSNINTTFNLDLLISQHQCLKYGDTILLSQASSFLCELDISPPKNNNSPLSISYNNNQSFNDSFLKPPSSTSTTNNRDLFNFSAISESNSTQPTIHSQQQLQQHQLKRNTYPCLQNMKKPTEEYLWKLEFADIIDLSTSGLTSKGVDNDPQTLMISSFVPSEMEPVDMPFKSKWLDGNDKLYNLYNTENAIRTVPHNVLQSNSPIANYEESAGSMHSISSDTSVPIISDKKLGKQPLIRSNDHEDSSDSEWSVSSSSSSLSSTPKNKALTEAEKFKLQIQQEFSEKEALAAIYKNVMFRNTTATPISNTTSQIRYYDDEELRTYTMTPGSRFNTPTSTANLTPEEQFLRRKSRESSFMMLVKPESKHEILLRAMEKSALNSWIRAIASPTTTKKETVAPLVNDLSMLSIATDEGDIRLKHYGSNNKTIQKKKGFYQVNNHHRASKSISM